MNRALVLAAGFAAGVSSVIVGHVVAQVADEGSATLECAGDFTEGGELHCTIHDLVTVPPTTTPPTTPPTTPTTLPPPVGALFFEDFTGDDMADFTATFDWDVEDVWRHDTPWQGHHNMACEGPTTERTLHHVPANDSSKPGDEFWLCGPSGPASDHLMTSNGLTGTFGITAFSPKQSFTGNRVCWDVNLTQSPGKRLWWEVQLLPAAAVANARSLAQIGTASPGIQSDRGTAHLGFGRTGGASFEERLLPANALAFDFGGEAVKIWRGSTNILPWTDGGVYQTTDRATRAHHCWVDNGNGTSTISQQRPGQADYVHTVNVSFPKPYRVIFAAHNYHAGKDGSLSSQTWHWDNILVKAN